MDIIYKKNTPKYETSKNHISKEFSELIFSKIQKGDFVTKLQLAYPPNYNNFDKLSFGIKPALFSTDPDYVDNHITYFDSKRTRDDDQERRTGHFHACLRELAPASLTETQFQDALSAAKSRICRTQLNNLVQAQQAVLFNIQQEMLAEMV